MLTDSAYNALLKTLEEPPKHVIFILCTTEVHKLPQTILSRCMRFDFKLVSLLNLTKLLEKIFTEKNIKYETEALHLIASRGEGSVRDTLSIADLCVSFSQNNITYKSVLEALGSSSTESLTNIANSIIENDGEKLLTSIESLATSGKNFNILGKELVNHFKTLLVIKTVKNAKEFLKMPQDLFDDLSSQANKISAEELLNIMTKLISIETQLKFSINPRTLIEITLLSLLNIEKKTEFVEKKTKIESLNEISFQKTENLEILSTKNVNNDDKNLKVSNIDDDVFDKKTISTDKLEAQKSVAKILKNLRENNLYLLSSIFQDLKNVEIKDNLLKISFENENYKEILLKTDNKNKINDIIKEDNLLVEYYFKKVIEEKSTIDKLKEKFNNIEIKE